MNKFIIPALGIIFLLVAIVIAVFSPDNYWLYMIVGGIGVGILIGDFLLQRARRRFGA
jgi:hypothetical protein